MAKYFGFVGTKIQEILGLTTSSGAGDAGKLVQTDSSGKLDQSLMPSGITPDQKTALANGALTARDMAYIDSGGEIARASAAAGGNAAQGFVVASAADGATATLQTEGVIAGFTGLTPGAEYFLSATTPGGISLVPGTAAGELYQFVGFAMSATELDFERDQPITRA